MYSTWGYIHTYNKKYKKRIIHTARTFKMSDLSPAGCRMGITKLNITRHEGRGGEGREGKERKGKERKGKGREGRGGGGKGE